MEEQKRDLEDYSNTELEKKDDIIIILKKLDGTIRSMFLLDGGEVCHTKLNFINLVGIIEQRDYPEFGFMVEEEFLDKVKEIYEKIHKPNCKLEIEINQINEILQKQNDEFKSIFEEE